MRKIKVGKKGRILIPKEIREKTGIRPGEELEITVEDGRIIVKLDTKKFRRELKGCIKEGKIKPEDIEWRM
ncbi:MAG: AbrB/MazE/SpoVT family DNA-binding domain-containing protein [Candidatus Aenigmatarchaeota archaeon]